MQGKEIVKMSTRKANFITLDELIAETGKDAVRYFFNMRSITTHLNFDLEIAKKQTDENPVFYLQYAHARICSIMRMAEEQKIGLTENPASGLSHEDEIRLLRKLWQFENEVLLAAENFEPQRITVYLEELAGLFHRFYTSCRIIGSEKTVAEARLTLCAAVRQTIKNGLSILGVSAPERM
jgi:arginyl-tRNA synthetase